MRAPRSSVFALSLLGLACVTPKAATLPMPDLSPAPAGTLTVGMGPGASDPVAQGAAFSAWVGEATGHATRPAVFPDYDSLATALAKGQVDVALISPLAYVRAEGQGKVAALGRTVRNGQSTYRAVLFTKAGNAIKSIDELKKAHELRAAWVDPSSATGYIFPKALLVQDKIDPAGLFKSQDFKGSHGAVCKAVAAGEADLGATYSDDPASGAATHANGCDEALGADAAKLQIVAATANIPNDLLATRDGLDADVSSKLNNGMNALAGSDAGKAKLKAIFDAQGFAPVAESDLDPVKAALDSFHEHVP